jgi:hypothetical protein
MQVDEDGQVKFKVYEAAAENNTDQKNPALRRLVSLALNPLSFRAPLELDLTVLVHLHDGC